MLAGVGHAVRKRRKRTVCAECGERNGDRDCVRCKENIHVLATNDIGKDMNYDAEEFVTIHCPMCDDIEITKARNTPKHRCKQCRYTGPFVIAHDEWKPK